MDEYSGVDLNLREMQENSDSLIELFVYQSKGNSAHFRSLHLSREGPPPPPPPSPPSPPSSHVSHPSHLLPLSPPQNPDLEYDNGPCRFSMLEFLLAPRGCVPIATSAPQCFPRISDGRAFLSALRSLYEGEAWESRVRFGPELNAMRSDLPQLCFAKNPALQAIPLLAHDLAILEIQVQSEEHRTQQNSLLKKQKHVARLLREQQQMPPGTLSNPLGIVENISIMGNNVQNNVGNRHLEDNAGNDPENDGGNNGGNSGNFGNLSFSSTMFHEQQLGFSGQELGGEEGNRFGNRDVEIVGTREEIMELDERRGEMVRNGSTNRLVGDFTNVQDLANGRFRDFERGSSPLERTNVGSPRVDTNSSWGTESLSAGSEEQTTARLLPSDPEEGTVVPLTPTQTIFFSNELLRSSTGTPWPDEDSQVSWSKSKFGALPTAASPSGSAHSHSRAAIDQVWSPPQLATNSPGNLRATAQRQLNSLQVATDDLPGNSSLPRATSYGELTPGTSQLDNFRQSGSSTIASLGDHQQDHRISINPPMTFHVPDGVSPGVGLSCSVSLPIVPRSTTQASFEVSTDFHMEAMRQFHTTELPSRVTETGKPSESENGPWKFHGNREAVRCERSASSRGMQSSGGCATWHLELGASPAGAEKSRNVNDLRNGGYFQSISLTVGGGEGQNSPLGETGNVTQNSENPSRQNCNLRETVEGSSRGNVDSLCEEMGQNSPIPKSASVGRFGLELGRVGRVPSDSDSASPTKQEVLLVLPRRPRHLEKRPDTVAGFGISPKGSHPTSSNGCDSSDFGTCEGDMETDEPLNCQTTSGMQLLPKAPTERLAEMTLEDLSAYFNLPINRASNALGVGLTVLKKRCREFGVKRWPHRMITSMDRLINNIQELAKSPEGGTSEPVQHAVQELENQKKRLQEVPGTELAERTKKLRQACFKAGYKRRRQASASKPAGNIDRLTKLAAPAKDENVNSCTKDLE